MLRRVRPMYMCSVGNSESATSLISPGAACLYGMFWSAEFLFKSRPSGPPTL